MFGIGKRIKSVFRVERPAKSGDFRNAIELRKLEDAKRVANRRFGRDIFEFFWKSGIYEPLRPIIVRFEKGRVLVFLQNSPDHLLRTANAFRLWQILPVICQSSDLEGDVPISIQDIASGSGLAFCSRRTDSILIPDGDFYETRGYNSIRLHYVKHSRPWHERKRIVFWRGTANGLPEGGDWFNFPRALGGDWTTLPRIKMARIAAHRPELFDVGISAVEYSIGDPKAPAIMEREGLYRPRVPLHTFQDHKFLIDIDGFSNAWGLLNKLMTGSTILKVASPHGFRQWYYDQLKPFEHFVPVAADLSDLIEKAEWVFTNDEDARAIGERGRELALSLTYETQAPLFRQAALDWINRDTRPGAASDKVPMSLETAGLQVERAY